MRIYMLILGLKGLKELCHGPRIKLGFNNPCELILSILNHPCFFMVYYYLFGIFHLSKLLFSDFLHFKSNFVRGQKNRIQNILTT